MLKAVRENLDCQLILCEPFMFCDNPENSMLITLRQYIEIVHELADQFEATLIPLQAEIDNIIGKVPPSRWSDDIGEDHLALYDTGSPWCGSQGDIGEDHRAFHDAGSFGPQVGAVEPGDTEDRDVDKEQTEV